MYNPEIVQVVPCENHVVYVCFSDGKIVRYDVSDKLDSGVFSELKKDDIFFERCKILNDTLAWDISGDGNPATCIDIDPETLYALPAVEELTA